MKRPGDSRPDPPGGRAAERLREFEAARRPPSPQKPKTASVPAPGAKKRKGGTREGGQV